jgi:hypothetical protein
MRMAQRSVAFVEGSLRTEMDGRLASLEHDDKKVSSQPNGFNIPRLLSQTSLAHYLARNWSSKYINNATMERIWVPKVGTPIT